MASSGEKWRAFGREPSVVSWWARRSNDTRRASHCLPRHRHCESRGRVRGFRLAKAEDFIAKRQWTLRDHCAKVAAMPFVRARHDDGDEEVFAVEGGSTVGQRDRHAVVLPAASVREDCGHLSVTPAGLRLVSTTPGEKSQSLAGGLRIGPFILDEVERGPSPRGAGESWSCRFRPRPLSRFGPLLVFAVNDRYAAGRALVVDLREEDPPLREAVTWLQGADALRPRRSELQALAESIEIGAPSQTRHLLAPTSMIQTRSVCALLFPFIPSLPFHALTSRTDERAGEARRGSVPRSVALVLQRQIRELLLERHRAGDGRYPLDWLRLRVGMDGRLRLPLAGPQDWREPSGQTNVNALVAAATAMLDAALEDESKARAVEHATSPESAPDAVADNDGARALAGWLEGVGDEALARQRRFFEQVAMMDLNGAFDLRDST